MRVEQSLKHILLLTLLLTLPLTAFTSYHVHNYSDKDGLSMNIGVSIAQDKQGYIWIGTQDGLNRFDGVDVKEFKKDSGLPNNFINALYSDSRGNLWVATRGGVARYDYNKENFYSYTNEKDHLIHNIVRCIKENDRHGILIGTEKGLNVIKEGKLQDYTQKDPLFGCKIQSIEVDNNTDTIYLGTLGDGLVIYNNGKLKQIKEEDKSGTFLDISINNIEALLLSDEGLWIGTDEGLALFKDGKFIKTYTTKEGLSNNGVNALFEDSERNFWIATTDGLNLMKEKGFKTYDISDDLAGNNVLSFCEDHEKGLWIGTYGGISYFGKGKFKTYSMKDGMPSNTAFGIYPAGDGKIWVACYGGIAIIDDRDENDVKITPYTTKDGLPSNTIRTITEDESGVIWIGTLGGGLARFQNGRFRAYTQKEGLPNNNVRVVYVDSNDDLWLGMQDGGLVLFDKKGGRVEQIYNTKTRKSLLNDNVRFIKEDRKRNLWVGVDGGICRFNLKEKTFTNYSPEDGLLCKDTHGILEDEGGYWITTFGNGLYFFDESLPKGKKFKQFTTADGLPDNCVYSVVKDRQERLWMPTNKGVCCWDRNADTFSYYTVNHGLPSNENNAHGGVKDKRGRIWFSTYKGVAWIDPEKVHKNETPPPVYVEQLKVGERIIDIHEGDQITLDPNPQNVYIKFTALSYQFPEGVKFKIRLEGFHKPDEWFEPLGNNRFVEYTNLPPGDYTFRVKAANSDGVWNKECASLAFTINPSFFQTIWFYVVLVIVIFALIAGYTRYRTAQQRRRQKKLEKMVEERTRELKETQAQLIYQGKMASLGEMAAGLAHEMNNPANYIYGNADYLQKYIDDVKSVLLAYMKLDLPEDHKIRKIREELDIDKKLEELDGLVKYVKEGATRISDIVSDLRFFVGKDEPELQKVDIHKHIETTLNLLHNKTKDRIEIEKYFGDISLIEGSSSQLNQAFMNILSNAADAIPDKGTITVETIFKGDQKIMIKISDTGEGIKNENLSRIFDPFFTTKTKEGGMGLGLSITKKIVERHNGSIDVESEVGKGTAFIITLPVKQESGET